MDWSKVHTPAKTRPDPPAPKLIRTLWVMTRPPQKSVTAGIYENVFGRELRVYYGSNEANIISTELSRNGDAPLEQHAENLRSVLESQGWVPVAGT